MSSVSFSHLLFGGGEGRAWFHGRTRDQRRWMIQRCCHQRTPAAGLSLKDGGPRSPRRCGLIRGRTRCAANMSILQRSREIIDDPSEVALIIPVDLTVPVRSREPDVPYTVERGSGLVRARILSGQTAASTSSFGAIRWGCSTARTCRFDGNAEVIRMGRRSISRSAATSSCRHVIPSSVESPSQISK